MKQPKDVENRGGAEGLIGIHAVKSAPADGYTLLASAGTMSQHMSKHLDASYDLLKDFMSA